MVLLIRGNFKRIFCWLLLLQLANLSINPARQHLQFMDGEATFMEDLTINSMESIYELVQEFVFKKDVPEKQDVHDQALGKIFVSFFEPAIIVFALVPTEYIVEHNYAYLYNLTECYPALDSPPPERIV